MRQLVFVVLGLLCLLVFPTVKSGDANLFLALWDEINSFVTPAFPTFQAYSTPPEIFVMSMPGLTIDPYAYDENTWRANNYVEVDPDYNLFQLTDSIPLNFPYYVDSGRKVSSTYLRFLQNYVTGIKQTQDEQDKIEQYRLALKKIMNDDFTPSPLAVVVNTTRNVVRDTLNVQLELRQNCLFNEDVGICQRKAVYWADAVSDQNMMYLVTQYEMLTAQAQVYSLTSRSLDSILFSQYERFMTSVRSSVGAKSFLGEYLQVRYDPTDWHRWWLTNATGTSAEVSFIKSGCVQDTSVKRDSTVFERNAWSSSGSYYSGIYQSSSSSYTTTNQRFDSTSEGQKVAINFELATVRIVRPWFDANIFDYSPLGISGTPLNYYSDGNYRGVFPWYISKLVVAKNVRIQMAKWSTAISQLLSNSNSGSHYYYSYGPFAGGSNSAFNSNEQRAATSFRFQNNELSIKGPQIIGYVMRKIPRFPNYAK